MIFIVHFLFSFSWESFLPLVYGLRNSVQINQPSGFQLETAKKAGLKAVNNESMTDAEKQNS